MRIPLKTILSYFVLLLSISVTAQDFQYFQWKKLTTESNTLKYKLPGNLYLFRSALRGSEFTTNDWSKGYLILQNGDRYDSLSLRYNSFLEELIMFNKETGALIMLDKYALSEFSMVGENGETQIFRKIHFEKSPKKDIFLRILYEGKLTLMLRYKTIELATSVYHDASGLLRSSELFLTETYYLGLPGKGLIKFTPGRRFFIALFPGQKKAIKKLHRQNRLRYKSNENIIKAVSLIETIIPD